MPQLNQKSKEGEMEMRNLSIAMGLMIFVLSVFLVSDFAFAQSTKIVRGVGVDENTWDVEEAKVLAALDAEQKCVGPAERLKEIPWQVTFLPMEKCSPRNSYCYVVPQAEAYFSCL